MPLVASEHSRERAESVFYARVDHQKASQADKTNGNWAFLKCWRCDLHRDSIPFALPPLEPKKEVAQPVGIASEPYRHPGMNIGGPVGILFPTMTLPELPNSSDEEDDETSFEEPFKIRWSVFLKPSQPL